MQTIFPPGWLLQYPWLWSSMLLLILCVIALIGHAVLFSLARRMAAHTSTDFDNMLLAHLRRPSRLFVVIMTLLLILPTLYLPPGSIAFMHRLGALGLIASTAWSLVALINVVNDFASQIYRLDVSDNLLARQFHTRFRVLRRIAFIAIGILAGAAALMTFPSVRQLGVSLLASAGMTGLVIGIAARSALANLIAGIQLAFTEPIRIDDVVIVEGEWGRVEEITTTYVVVRIWDLRRLVVPLSYFIEKPFQNWTRVSAELLGTVYIYADYTVPVVEMRQTLRTLLETSGLWDGKVWGLQVTNATEHTLELRALMSAKDSGSAWDLRCHVREGLVAWLQERYPGSLPRVRAEFDRVESRESFRPNSENTEASA
jgi:small-conductance mechanosensitive channel